MSPYWEPAKNDMFPGMIDHPDKEKEQLAASSPALHADRIKAPLLIARGTNDPRVKKSKSDQIIGALRVRGVAVEYMVRDNEGHGFLNEENRFAFYEAMELLLARTIGNARGMAATRDESTAWRQYSVR